MSYEEIFVYLLLSAAGLVIFFITYLMVSSPEEA